MNFDKIISAMAAHTTSAIKDLDFGESLERVALALERIATALEVERGGEDGDDASMQ